MNGVPTTGPWFIPPQRPSIEVLSVEFTRDDGHHFIAFAEAKIETLKGLSRAERVKYRAGLIEAAKAEIQKGSAEFPRVPR